MRVRSWPVAVAAVLLLLLGGLATLQYRWVGEVSAAERARLEASVRARGAELASDVDGDLSRTFAAFQVDSRTFERDPAGALADAVARAGAGTASGASVRAIYVAEPGGRVGLRRLDVRGRTLVDAPWPAELSGLRDRVAALPAEAVAGLPLLPGFFNDPIDRESPAFIVPITAPEPPLEREPGRLVVRTIRSGQPWHAVIVWLDADRLRDALIAPLVVRQFGEPATSEFNVSIVRNSDGRRLYDSGPPVNLPAADFSSTLFALRFDDLVWRRAAPAGADGDGSAPAVKDQVAITIVRRGVAGEDAGAPHVVQQGASWTLAVQAKRGSLEAVVARSRRRNLALGLGVLGVLGAGLGLLLAAAAREQRIARQQLEFVASVSHELRTPLAVIRSAAENLADGVTGGDSVREYGALIRSEGRRLSDMIERVMDFAGITAGTLIRSRRDVDVAVVVDAAIAAVAGEAAERGVAIDARLAPGLTPVAADADALQTALQNAIGNAVKYSRADGRVEVDVVPSPRGVEIRVADRGIGIDAADLPHVFKPFYRGRRAVDSQARGSGVGLAVVQKIVAAHGGEVRIAGREGGGTVLTIALPAERQPAERA